MPYNLWRETPEHRRKKKFNVEKFLQIGGLLTTIGGFSLIGAATYQMDQIYRKADQITPEAYPYPTIKKAKNEIIVFEDVVKSLILNGKHAQIPALVEIANVKSTIEILQKNKENQDRQKIFVTDSKKKTHLAQKMILGLMSASSGLTTVLIAGIWKRKNDLK